MIRVNLEPLSSRDFVVLDYTEKTESQGTQSSYDVFRVLIRNDKSPPKGTYQISKGGLNEIQL